MADRTAITVGIAGAGAIALAVAVLLEEAGHRAVLWSPSGEGTAAFRNGAPLVAEGAVTATVSPAVASSAAALCEADALILALPAYGHKTVMDQLAPHIKDDQPVIISSHAALGALYLSKLLAARGLQPPIVAWGTTVATARRKGPSTVAINTVRSRVDIATLPTRESERGQRLCTTLFGERFNDKGALLAVQLSNLNPQNHMGIALCNMTRMEQGETWSQGANVTPNVGRLLEALDRERLAIAGALGLKVRTIFEHFHLSFHVPEASVSAMNQQMHAQGRGGTGPATADSRYVTEDVPYGLAATVTLGAMTGRPAVLHQAGVDLFSALYGRDFAAQNDLFAALDLGAMPIETLEKLAEDGFSPANSADKS
ncbi:MAG: NAD/NADP octopine/nopaline dehydrogenase family protein [Pseudomonadota bacterium]